MVAFAHAVVRRLLAEYAIAEDPAAALVRRAEEEHPDWWALEDVDVVNATGEDWDRIARQIAQMVILTYAVPASVPLVDLVSAIRKTFPSY